MLTGPAKHSPLLFPGRWPDIPLSTSSVRKIVIYYGGQARVKLSKCHPHNFRHGIAKYLLQQGATLKQVQNHLGHSNIATTARYLDYTEEETDRWYHQHLE